MDTVELDEKPVATFDDNETITFGRDVNNVISLVDDWVSPTHARIERRDQYVLVDLGSETGIHHNGRRVSGVVVLESGDTFAIGRHGYLFRAGGVYRSQNISPTLIEAYDLTVHVDSRPLLRRRFGRMSVLIDDVSFVVRRGTMLGIVGPSGSGKSTLMKAITGIRPATQGRLLVAKEELYEERGPHRDIGVVPQADILHQGLSVRRALRYAAALRCPREMTRQQRLYRIDEVLQQLDLTKQQPTRIDQLSGGQRKRTSVALELLTVPPLLCLDEPTSGLDPALDRDVMGALRDLANDGRTVIVATHNPMHLDACDFVLVMCVGGRMAYFGPPGDELLKFFGAGLSYAHVFREITDKPELWAQRYRNSEIYRLYVGREQEALLKESSQTTAPAPARPVGRAHGMWSRITGRPPATPARPVPRPPRAVVARAKRPPHPGRQLLTLCLRMASLILSDRKYALLVLGLPAVLAGLSRLVPGDKGLAPDPGGFSLEANRLLVVLITGAAFMGIAAPIREIINEAEIYRRERAVGLSPTGYLLSKFIMFALIDVAQAVIFVLLTLLGRGTPKEALVLPNPTLELMVAVALVAIASSALGLLVSALVRTVEQTTPYLVVSVMAQLILSGGLFQFIGQRPLEIVAWFDPSRWGYAAAAATTNLSGFPFPDPQWHHDAGSWWTAVVYVLIHISILFGLARLALTRYEPGRG